MKLVAVVVLYYPKDDVFENIASYVNGCDFVIVWDNTPKDNITNHSWKEKLLLNGDEKLYYMSDGSNRGLAYAYNRAIEKSLTLGATHIMTMDQDSRFLKFEYFKEYIEKNEFEKCLFCPPINTDIKEDVNKEVSNAAQSGCVHSLDMIQKIGSFREDFFIGMVDVEMQLRAAEYGYRILQVGGCNLIHHIGSERVVTFLHHEIQVLDYSPLRHYYDSRNRILMWKEFPYDYNWNGKLKFFISRIKLCLKILLFEEKKLKKIGAIIKGLWNGIWNRVVPYN